MKKERIIYFFVTILFIASTVFILNRTNLSNNVELSKSIQILLILYLIRISYGCTIYIRNQYRKQAYSYGIIMNLGLLIFININILRQINLLIVNWNIMNIIDIYNNTLTSFSFFAMLTLPCIIVLSIYSIITNIILIKKERFTPTNLLGIFLGMFALIGLFGSQMIYIITAKLLIGKKVLIIKKLIDIIINITLSYFYTLIIATLYCNIRAGKHTPKYDKDFVIILGSQIRKDGTLPPLLKARADKAIEFGKKQYEEKKKEIYYVPSGGKGTDESIAEARAIKNYLLNNGIDKKHIIIEDKSTNTIQNMMYSKEKIDKIKKNANISFSTTNYHVFRSGVIANNCGIECEGMGSKTKWYFYTNALIREFVANLFQERKKHIYLIIIINIFAIILILIGYYNQLIKF
ncbi:MAG: YdcF family protein [Bacilli bacterium]|nr:YdcF family protein [Bacilli bacterium]